MLTKKDQEIIAVAASVASGCQPCTTFHIRASRASGVPDVEIRQAVNDAVRERRGATEIMIRKATSQLEDARCPDELPDQPKTLIGELSSIGAAYAANCVTNLQVHLEAARNLGASDDQIMMALKIACAVKDMAAIQVRDAAAKAMGVIQDQQDDCGCDQNKTVDGKIGQCGCQN